MRARVAMRIHVLEHYFFRHHEKGAHASNVGRNARASTRTVDNAFMVVRLFGAFGVSSFAEIIRVFLCD